MKENLKLKLKGFISLLVKGKEPLLAENNAIHEEAFKAILNCLPGAPTNGHIDQVRVMGDFGNVDKQITNSIVDNDNLTVTLICPIFSEECVGVIEELQLRQGLTEFTIATKTGLSIEKDDATEMEIRWKITLIAE